MFIRLALATLSKEYETSHPPRYTWKRDLVSFLKTLNGSEKAHDFLSALRENSYVLYCDELFQKYNNPLSTLKFSYREMQSYAEKMNSKPYDFYAFAYIASHGSDSVMDIIKIVERHEKGHAVLPSSYQVKNANISKSAKVLYREFFRIADKVLVSMQSELPAMRELHQSIKEFFANTHKLKEIEKRLDQRESSLSDIERRLNLALEEAETIRRENEAQSKRVQERADQIETLSDNLKDYFNTIKAQNDQLLSGSPNTPNQQDTLNDMLSLIERLKKP